ncbi:MAG: hypothetical protein Q7T30_02150, partial [Planctomycetota bacterium]|nr:hypothetical protein [Planctomycetota bacterium]
SWRGGSFTMAGRVAANRNRIASWAGTSWSALDTGMYSSVIDLTTLPNGDLVAGGSFITAGGVSANRIARWNGTSWSALGTGMDGFSVGAMATLSNGDLAVGGDFLTAGGTVSAYFARYHFCLANYTVFGAGCAGSLGVPGNIATALPRIGTTMAVDITNMPQNAGFFMIGWSNTTWTNGALPFDLGVFGAPGCMWRVSDTVTMLLLGSNNVATYNLTIPNDSSFLSAQFYTQCVVLDTPTNTLGAVVSNAATAVIGQ